MNFRSEFRNKTTRPQKRLPIPSPRNSPAAILHFQSLSRFLSAEISPCADISAHNPFFVTPQRKLPPDRSLVLQTCRTNAHHSTLIHPTHCKLKFPGPSR